MAEMTLEQREALGRFRHEEDCLHGFRVGERENILADQLEDMGLIKWDDRHHDRDWFRITSAGEAALDTVDPIPATAA